VARLTRAPDDTFSSTPIDVALELSGTGGTASGLIVHLVDASWSGRFDGATVASPLTLQGGIVLEDVVQAAQILAGLDHDAAVAFLAGLFGFDPVNPPENIPFRGEMTVDTFGAP
jgi:hypothetical protein